MQFGILFTSQPNPDVEPYPHRDVHQRVTEQIVAADRLGFDYAWIAEHHFSSGYGILPDPFVYLAYLADKTERLRLGTAVMTLPLNDPLRVVENAAFIDILTNGRFALGLGSGYRPYEFAGLGVDFERRRDIQEEALPLVLEMLRTHRVEHRGAHFSYEVTGEYEIFPHSVQQPHPPLYLAAGTERSIGVAAKLGLGLLMSSLAPVDVLAQQTAVYRREAQSTTGPYSENPAFGTVDVARWVYVADTDEQARAESEAGVRRHHQHFLGKQTFGHLGQVTNESSVMLGDFDYERLVDRVFLHGSVDTVARRIEELQAKTGCSALTVHYPPYYGHEQTLKMLRLFAEQVIPRCR
ncbi:MAG: LLM class flavin-dependent oxidoreductase [Chloroflexi bacterium]|nr:LLM class flavin-dependent oxidoreductase [Chloroflexota bacterium]